MEAVVPVGWFVGLLLPGFGGGSVDQVLSIAHMIGLFKGVRVLTQGNRIQMCRPIPLKSWSEQSANKWKNPPGC